MEIKPCPFCGSGRINLITRRSNDEELFFMKCTFCGVKLEPEEEEEDAIEVWNRRAWDE